MDSTSEDEIKGANLDGSQVPNPALVPKSSMGTQGHPKKGHIRLIISLLTCLAWICPITFLLVLNWEAYIVGASVGCGFRHTCDFDPYAENSFAQAQRLDKRDHDIMGALQFVAKALEVWFIVIAACLAYDLTMMLAVKHDGLPIGYLMTHVEFSDLKSLFEPSFWSSVKSLKRDNGRRHQWNFWLCGFVFFMSCLCVLSNLMGPATAILVLPAQGWRDTHPIQPITQFERVASANPPSNLPTCDCDTSALAAGNYTCTDQYSATLDQWSSAVWAGLNLSMLEFKHPEPNIQPLPITEEADVSFTFNVTKDSNQPFWTPSRQVLLDISNDQAYYSIIKDSKSFGEAKKNTSDYVDQYLYKSYRNSLKALIHRRGPILGFNGWCYPGNVSLVPLSKDKSIRCYNYNDTNTLDVKCILAGSDWSESKTNHSRFFIGDSDPSSAGNVEVDIYSTSKAVYSNARSLPCSEFQNIQDSQRCWDSLFASEPSSKLRSMSLSQQIFEYNIPRLAAPNATVWCENYIYYNLSDYTLDPDDFTNPLSLVELNNTPNVTGTDPTTLHPDWFLAAWSIARSGTVNGYRAAARNTISALKSLVNSPPSPSPSYAGNLLLFNFEHLFTVGQAMSLVSYDYTNLTAHPSATHSANITAQNSSVSKHTCPSTSGPTVWILAHPN